MRIFIDADGCPRPVKDLAARASQRLKLKLVLVADRPVSRPASPLASTVVVPRDMDSADAYIVKRMEAGDLVITADLPLAAQAVEAGGYALNPRGELYDDHNVRERLSVRDFLMGLRETGAELGGPPPFGPKDAQRFAEALDRFLTRRLREQG